MSHRMSAIVFVTGAVASTEVKQKLQEFLLNKSTNYTAPNGSCNTFTQNSKLWFT